MAKICTLGPFRLDTQDVLLFHGSEPVALGRRAIALLRALVERPGAVVSKDALIEAAWPGQTVEESNLTVQIAALRRVLGEEPGGDRWIETMPRRGYRFVGPVVTEVQKGVTEAPPRADARRDATPIEHGEAERRQITAMSCGLIGIAGRADLMDLDDWREAVGAFRRCASETAGRHHGFIYRHLGNNVLALFGYPEAHEHDAEQAVRAGLELCTAVRALRPDAEPPMRCRVGIATGMVIIGDSAGVDEGRDHEIVGDTPGLAAQLQISVQPETVAIDPATRRLIGNLFDCCELDTIETSGGAETTHRWQVLGESLVASRFEALRGTALGPLIGREEEVSLLLRRWARAKAGDGQVVLISGEPGIGKSRLVAALAERLQAERYLRLRCFCSPHHQDSTLSPSIDQLGRAAGFARDDPLMTKLEKLEAVLARAEPRDEDVALLADLLSLPDSDQHPLPNLSPQRKKERTLEALVRQLEGLARQQPVMTVFEDAHWIDPTSRELLDLTIDRLRTMPVLLIVTFRPEFQPPWRGQPQVTMLALRRLDRRDQTALVMQIAGGKALPDDVVARIVDRTDGIPLFVEELTKSVLESGLLREEADCYLLDGALPALAIPATLHASLMARLDRLASARQVAQIGAAIGRDFSYELLRAVSRLPEGELEVSLGRLVTSELVSQRGTPPDAVYAFKHALVRDAAHGTLLRGARQQLHAQIAEVLEAQSPELIDNQPELFAQHYGAAGLIEKSVAAWGKAGQRSAARSELVEAAAQFQKALDQLALLPDTPGRRRQELEFCCALGAVLRAVKGHAAPETGQAYARAIDLWQQLGSPSEFLYIPYVQSYYYMARGEFDAARRLDEVLLRSSDERDDAAGRFLGHFSSGRTLTLIGRFSASRSHLEAALGLCNLDFHSPLVHQTGFDPQVTTQTYLGIVLVCLGYPEQALARVNAAIAHARRLAHPPSLAVCVASGGIPLTLVGDNAALSEWTDELAAVAAEQGFSYWQAVANYNSGWIKMNNDHVCEGISLLRSGLAAFRATGAEAWTPYLLGLLAKGCEIAGQNEEAVALLDEALQIAERTGERWFEAELHRHKGQLLLQQGHAEAAEDLHRKALSIAQEQQAKLWELRAAVSLARLRRDQGRRAEARELLAPVYGWFSEGFDMPDLKEAKALLEELV
jgi:DNA-binding winged helix-turn-helix (wHTH) protein/predicted ATPase